MTSTLTIEAQVLTRLQASAAPLSAAQIAADLQVPAFYVRQVITDLGRAEKVEHAQLPSGGSGYRIAQLVAAAA